MIPLFPLSGIDQTTLNICPEIPVNVQLKSKLSLLLGIMCSIPGPSTRILKVKVNVFVTFKHISDVNRKL